MIIRNRTTIFALGVLALFVVSATFTRLVMTPILLSFTASYLLNPIMEWLDKKGLKRASAAALVVTSIGILTCLFLWIIMPIIIFQINLLIKIFPQALSTIDKDWIPSFRLYLKQNFAPTSEPFSKLQFYDIVSTLFHDPDQTLFESLSKSTRYVISWIVTIILTPVFFFFTLKDFKRIKKIFFSLVPIDIRLQTIQFIRSVDFTLRSVLRGQLTVVGILCILYSTSFGIIGFPAGIAIGITTGIARLVPYLDILVGGTLCFFVILIKAPASSIVVSLVIAFVAIQIFDGIFLTPKIMGQFSGLNPFLIIISVLSFGDWFGFYGVLIAIPTAAIMRVLLEKLIQTYLNSEFMLGQTTNIEDS